MSQIIKIVEYKWGLLSNQSFEDFINTVLQEEKDYNLFQVIENPWWALGYGITRERSIVLIKK